MNLMRFWTSVSSSGKRSLAQLYAGSGFVDQVDGLVGQEAVGDVAVGMRDREIDGVVGVGDGVEFFVAIFDAEQNLDRVDLVRRRNFHGLEAALERTIFFDRLAVFAGRGGADALNFAARQRGLQNVGGVERTFRRSGADQRVQLVDEDDGILRLHQFLHDGLEALFELAAILGAGDDQREIESEDALVGEERRNFAVGDALGQSFDDGSFADAGLADQHRIVLGAAAENLDDAIDFAFAADQRIELAVHGGLGQIARKFREQRTFTLPLRLSFFLRAAGQLFADGREAQAALVQNLGGEALFFSQQTQQQMFGADVAMRKALGFLRGIGENPLAFIAQREIDRSRNLLADGGVSLDLLANGFDRGVGAQETIGQGFIFAQESEKQVLSLDIGRPELAGFVACEKDDAPGFLRIAFKHNALPPDFPGREKLVRPTYRTRSLILPNPILSPLCNQRASKPKY